MEDIQKRSTIMRITYFLTKDNVGGILSPNYAELLRERTSEFSGGLQPALDGITLFFFPQERHFTVF